MKFFKLTDKISELHNLREYGNEKGVTTGFNCLDEYYTLKKGYPLFIAGSPFAGKTEFALDLLLNTSLKHGWKHFIYSGEAGDVQNIFAELISKYCKKPFIKSNAFSMSESEKTKAEMFINEHFFVANIDNDYTIESFFETISEAENYFSVKFDTTLFDPFNDIIMDFEAFSNREDRYLADALKKVRISSKKNNRIDILINHIADIKAVTDKDTGNRFMPPALPNEWAGGRTWWRRGFGMLLVYRPPTFINNEHGIPFCENETQIFVQKAKPKGIGKIGRCSLFWNWKTNRYEERSITGNIVSEIELKDFTISKREHEMPF